MGLRHVAFGSVTLAILEGLDEHAVRRVAVSLTSVGIAVVVARAGRVWLCVAVLSASYLVGVMLERSPAELSAEGQVGTVVAAAVVESLAPCGTFARSEGSASA